MRSALPILAALALLPAGGFAQTECGLLGTAGCTTVALPPGTRAGLAEFVSTPVAAGTPLERAVRALLPSLLGDLDVDIKMFETDESDETGLGFAYSWARDFARWGFEPASANVHGGTLSLHADGNVAFDADINPHDFLRTGASLGWLVSRGGVTGEVSEETAAELSGIVMQLARLPAAELETHPLNQRALAIFAEALSTQVAVTIDGTVQYESDQTFEARQLAWGARAGLDVKAWNPHSTLAKLNVFDWPFALTRWLTGVERVLRPRGSAIPGLLVGLDRVDPAEDSARAAVADLEPFSRFVAEAGMRTVAGKVRGGLVHAAANVRLYQELGASEAARAADLDRALYFAVALTAPGGLYVSYATGRLPFDRRDDQVYEVGFRYRF